LRGSCAAVRVEAMSTRDEASLTAADREHLELLSIFHYVVAGITGLASLLPMAHLALGLSVISRASRRPGLDELVAAAIGWFFVLFAALAIACGIGFAACLAVAGRSLARRERYTFCLVVAAVACVLVPFGTLLGIFSLLVLMRPSVRAGFGRGEPPRAPEPPAPPAEI